MTIEAKIIADSISLAGIRLTTMQLRYPRFIHSEFMTHRAFSRNASSSRAIPVTRMIEDLRRDPAMPVFWGSNKPGMQAGAELNEEEIQACKHNWLNSMENAIHSAELLVSMGLHKQIANRMLEPWAHINVVVTATDWENFFNLRCHPDAQPEIQELANRMREIYLTSVPIKLRVGEWHLPYIREVDLPALQSQSENGNPETAGIKVSVARCARVSFLTHDGRETTVEEDIKLYERLVGSAPLHASPAEHQAMPDTMITVESEQHLDEDGTTKHLGVKEVWANPHLHGNFNGWIQYRKQLEQNIRT